MRTLQSMTLLLLAFLVITLVSPNPARAQLDRCSPLNETQCLADDDCHVCTVEYGICKLNSNPCIECVDLSQQYCSQGVGCYWCQNKGLCLPDGESCTCGDGFFQIDEECDSGFNCLEDCTCPDNYVPDGWAGCQTDPDIRIKGNGRDIQDGDLDPRPIDHTDFGNILVNGGSQTRTYTIENNDLVEENLLLGNPAVTIGGANPADFTVTTQPVSTTVAPGGSVTFTVTFDPFATEVRSAVISIDNNDADENPYNFAIQGTGTALPVVTTDEVTSVSDTIATCEADVITLGFPAPTQHGCVWNTVGSPTTGDWKTEEGPVSAEGPFTSQLEGLSPKTTYYVRAYATNHEDTAYGDEISFTTKEAFPWELFLPAILSGTKK